MTKYVMDWTRVNLCGSNALGDAGLHVEISTSEYLAVQEAAVTADFAGTGLPALQPVSDQRDPVVVTVTFDKPVRELGFSVLAPGLNSANRAGRLTVLATGAGASFCEVRYGPLGADTPVDGCPGMGGLRVEVDGPVLGLTLIYDAGSRALKAGELGVTALAFAPAERRSVAPVMARDLIAQAAARAAAPAGAAVPLNPAREFRKAVLTMVDTKQFIPGFVAGTMIATERGERAVESLRRGERVATRDGGLRTLRFVGHVQLTAEDLDRHPHLRPVIVPARSLGRDLPTKPLKVGRSLALLAHASQPGTNELFVPASQLPMGNAGGVAEGEVLTYVHLVFDEPQVVMANGLWARTGSAIDARLLGGLPAPKASKRSQLPPLASQQELDGSKARAAAPSAPRRLRALLPRH